MLDGWTYDTLKAALQDWTEDDNPEFIAQLARIIGLGQIKVRRDLDLEILDVTRRGSFTAGNSQIDKPDGYLSMRSLFFDDYDCRAVYIEQRSYDFIQDVNRDPMNLGRPRYWCELDDRKLCVAPRPEANFCWTARIIERAQVLSEDTPTTWIAQNVPDALLYACLMHCEEYLKDDQRLEVWRGRYNNEVIPAARNELRRVLRNDYSPQTAVTG